MLRTILKYMKNETLQNINTLVIPDVHGRTFWRYAIDLFPKSEYPNLNIVFLGDYVDPYDFENISRNDAIFNFKEILDIAKIDDRIHLLIGNHDMHYFYDAPYKSRVDYLNYTTISKLFKDNMDLFNVAFENIINGIKYLYTHAGVTSYWLKHLQFMGQIGLDNKRLNDDQKKFCKMLSEMTPDADKLNKLLGNFQGEANLWMPSWYRGGDYQDGSCIWADLREWAYSDADIEGIFQIFGHTLIGGGDVDAAVIKPDNRMMAMLDSRKAWGISNNGEFINILELENE